MTQIYAANHGKSSVNVLACTRCGHNTKRQNSGKFDRKRKDQKLFFDTVRAEKQTKLKSKVHDYPGFNSETSMCSTLYV